ncbi:hypothetical protein BKA61DRAFT_620837 [Leptodontidium sp. MPI-SDFR-AT-0119]|nr:hypothetical protein BKA61DRAFT_620837 [Leptodontidium sp. MPI-SDFR-AT-0119]
MITLEAIFGLLAVVIMLLPSAIHLLRWLHRRFGNSNNQSDPCHDPVLSQMSPSARYRQFEDIEMQSHTRSLGHYKRSVSATYLSVVIKV